MNLDPRLAGAGDHAAHEGRHAGAPLRAPVRRRPDARVCRRTGIPLVEDAAQAHGARYKGRTVGTFGELADFSFYPGKNLGACGEGGALVTQSRTTQARARALREHGRTERYYHDEVGYNYRMEGLQGAVLSVKLRHLPAWNASAPAHRAPLPRAAGRHAAEAAERSAQARERLPPLCRAPPGAGQAARAPAARGIGSALHYPLPLHLQKCFAALGHKAGDFPVTERAAASCLSLPIFPELTDAQVDYVAAMIGEFKEW